ncbi:MAG: HD domain-containing protein [Fimbriimonadaceae bacterium]|nr:MAG: HD domain-containing protein [Fimbriimonadaceae bacterium]
MSYDRRFINDPIHGSMGFSELELKVIETPVFRRLRNIKQLGMAELVYPTANYSRFAHSLGVCHLAGRFMEQLEKGSDILPNEIKLTRLAALTHDIGHYPFSHSFENALKRYAREEKIEGANIDLTTGGKKSIVKHEAVGARVLKLDSELAAILKGIDPDEVARRFRRESAKAIGTNVISSDFDVDRTDYLLRTAHSAGLPYGKVDLDYLIGVLELREQDSQHLVTLPPKAMRAAEHFLLGRFFDYQTVAFHKTVTAFESVLEEAIVRYMRSGAMDCSKTAIENMIKNGEWITFDDTWFIQKMILAKGKCGSSPNDKSRYDLLVHSLVSRIPPKLIGEVEFLAHETSDDINDFENRVLEVKDALEKTPGLESKLISWTNPGMKLTKLGTLAKSSGEDAQDADQLVHIRLSDHSLVPMINMKRSLMNVLSNYRWYCARFYSLERNETKVKKWRNEARECLTDKFGADNVTLLSC